MRRSAAALVIAAALVAAAQAQAPDGVEVASIKRTQGAPGVLPFVFTQSNRLRAPFSTVRELVQAAYGVDHNQVVGGPAWIDTDFFEVNATLPEGTTPERARVMLQRLLVERFSLVTRRETRELPAYVLERAARLGPGISPAGAGCKPLKAPSGLPAPPPPPPPPPGAGPVTALNLPPGSRCGNVILSGFFSLRAIPMVTFVTNLSRQIRLPIVDRTALTGLYDVDLSFLPDSGPMMINGTAVNADAPSLQTAVREQLGLRLDSRRAPIDVVVIERVTPPTEN